MQTDIHSSEQRRPSASRVLIATGVGSLVLAGLLLWSLRGDAVFSDMVLTALAWCF